MYHVLVPVDTTEERAREQASYVAGLAEAGADVEATVVHAFVEGEGEDVPTAMQNPERVSSVKAARDLLEEADIGVTVGEISEPPQEEVVREARERDADEIVVAGRHANPVGKALFGSVAQQIVLNADRPVTVVGRSD